MLYGKLLLKINTVIEFNVNKYKNDMAITQIAEFLNPFYSHEFENTFNILSYLACLNSCLDA